MAFNPRLPSSTAPFVGRQSYPGFGKGGGVQVGYVFWTSENMKKLLYPQRKGQDIVSRINELHREMAGHVAARAEMEYNKRRKRRANQRRDARRPARKLENALYKAARSYGRGHPMFKDPEGFGDGIKAASGFMVDFTVFDKEVTDERGFPYWRSVEFGYGAFLAERPMFLSAGGKWRAPTASASAHIDPRMPQRVNWAPFEQVPIKAFPGYGFIEEAIRDSAIDFKANYGMDMLGRLPDEWARAAELIAGGAPVGQVGGRGPRRILFQTEPRSGF